MLRGASSILCHGSYEIMVPMTLGPNAPNAVCWHAHKHFKLSWLVSGSFCGSAHRYPWPTRKKCCLIPQYGAFNYVSTDPEAAQSQLLLPVLSRGSGRMLPCWHTCAPKHKRVRARAMRVCRTPLHASTSSASLGSLAPWMCLSHSKTCCLPLWHAWLHCHHRMKDLFEYSH